MSRRGSAGIKQDDKETRGKNLKRIFQENDLNFRVNAFMGIGI
jgi:hypothetical protein